MIVAQRERVQGLHQQHGLGARRRPIAQRCLEDRARTFVALLPRGVRGGEVAGNERGVRA